MGPAGLDGDQATLWDAITARYAAAQAAAAATVTETRVETLADGGVDFVVRVAAVLRDKPAPPPSPGGGGPPKAWTNPFLPPDPALLVRHVSATHSVVLNKFNLVPHHCLVVTRAFEPQEAPLTAADWAATAAVVAAMPSPGGLAFFNCGPESGASQPHKHLQVVPRPLAAAGGGADPPLAATLAAALAPRARGERAALRGTLPFAAYAALLRPAATAAGADGGELAAECAALLGMARAGGHLGDTSAANCGGGPAAAALPRSYNLILTRELLLLVPRRAERDGPVAANAVAFAGSLFVRTAEEAAYLRARGPMAVLAAVGVPW